MSVHVLRIDDPFLSLFESLSLSFAFLLFLVQAFPFSSLILCGHSFPDTSIPRCTCMCDCKERMLNKSGNKEENIERVQGPEWVVQGIQGKKSTKPRMKRKEEHCWKERTRTAILFPSLSLFLILFTRGERLVLLVHFRHLILVFRMWYKLVSCPSFSCLQCTFTMSLSLDYFLGRKRQILLPEKWPVKKSTLLECELMRVTISDSTHFWDKSWTRKWRKFRLNFRWSVNCE